MEQLEQQEQESQDAQELNEHYEATEKTKECECSCDQCKDNRIKTKTVCCGKEMIEIKGVWEPNADSDITRFWCGECGKFIDIREYQLDEEELISEIGSNEEMLNTKVHKDFMKDGVLNQDGQEV